MKTYLAYVRVSTLKQEFEEQKNAIRKYATLHGLTISMWFEEKVTAAKTGRQMFNRMLAELERGVVSGVIMHKIDRGARNPADWARLGELVDLGIEVIFAHESVDLTSRGGRLAADIQAVVAADYVRNLRQEVRKGFNWRLSQGYYPLPAPRGYLNQGKAKAKTIDPINGPLVRQAFELYASGAHSYYTLAQEMRRRGLSAQNGKAIAKNGFVSMFNNPFYIGIIRIERTGETFQGLHEPLITAQLFDKVQKVINGRSFSRPRRHDPVFRRMIKCENCEKAVVAELHKDTTYYRCHSRSCHGNSVKEHFLLEDLQSHFDSLPASPEELREFRDVVTTEATAHNAVEVARREEKKRRLNLCEARLTRLTDAFLDQAIEKEIFEERKAGLLFEKRNLLDELKGKEFDTLGGTVLEQLEKASFPKYSINTTHIEEVREMIKLTSSKLSLSRKELVIKPRFPFGEVQKWRAVQSSPPCTPTYRNGCILFPLRVVDGRTTWLDLTDVVPIEASSPVDFFNALRDIETKRHLEDSGATADPTRQSPPPPWRSAA